MLRGEIGAVTLPQVLHEATKLTVHVGRQERVYRGTGLCGGVRPAAPARDRGRDGAAGGGRHRPRRSGAGPVFGATRTSP